MSAEEVKDKIFLHRFWEEHPDAAAIPAFSALRSKRGEEASSRIMWYLRFLYDPSHEYIHKLPKRDWKSTEERQVPKSGENTRESLLKDFCGLKASDFSSPTFKAADAWYRDNFMSKAKQVFYEYGEKLEQAKAAVKARGIYDVEDIGIVRQSMKSLREFTEEYETIEAFFNQERKAENKATKIFGKDENVRPIDDGSLFT